MVLIYQLGMRTTSYQGDQESSQDQESKSRENYDNLCEKTIKVRVSVCEKYLRPAQELNSLIYFYVHVLNREY